MKINLYCIVRCTKAMSARNRLLILMTRINIMALTKNYDSGDEFDCHWPTRFCTIRTTYVFQVLMSILSQLDGMRHSGRQKQPKVDVIVCSFLVFCSFLLTAHGRLADSHLFSTQHPPMHACIHSFIHSFIHSSIHPSIHSSVQPSIYSFIYSFIHLSIHSSIVVRCILYVSLFVREMNKS